MNLQSIIVANSIGIAVLIILQISSYLVRQRKKPSDRIFTVMITLTSIACASETLSFIADGRSFVGAHVIAVITGTLTYAINVSVSYLWCIYVDLRLYKEKSRLKKYPSGHLRNGSGIRTISPDPSAASTAEKMFCRSAIISGLPVSPVWKTGDSGPTAIRRKCRFPSHISC